jgi:hypothetical protein
MVNREWERQQPLERDRISILLAVTLTGAALSRFVELPSFSWSVRRILGSPLGFTIGSNWLLSLLMMGLVATGTYSLMQMHPQDDHQERPLIFSLIVPTLGALFASLLLLRAAAWPIWLGSLLLTGLIIGLLVHLTYQVYSLGHRSYATLRALLNIIDYLLGFALFGFVLSAQERSLVTGPAILLLSGLLSLDLLSASGAKINRVLLFSGITAFLIGESTWILSYWPISPWAAATVLTLELYVGAGISYQYLLDKLNRRMLMEYAVLALLVFGLILIIKP